MVIKDANDKYMLKDNKPNKEHLNFERIIGSTVIKPQEVQINLLLKATGCHKATNSDENKHRSDCNFIDRNRPYINCVVCNKDWTSTDVFIDCIRHQDVKERNAIRNKKCSGEDSLRERTILVA